jgi:hypothetical protein
MHLLMMVKAKGGGRPAEPQAALETDDQTDTLVTRLCRALQWPAQLPPRPQLEEFDVFGRGDRNIKQGLNTSSVSCSDVPHIDRQSARRERAGAHQMQRVSTTELLLDAFVHEDLLMHLADLVGRQRAPVAMAQDVSKWEARVAGQGYILDFD